MPTVIPAKTPTPGASCVNPVRAPPSSTSRRLTCHVTAANRTRDPGCSSLRPKLLNLALDSPALRYVMRGGQRGLGAGSVAFAGSAAGQQITEIEIKGGLADILTQQGNEIMIDASASQSFRAAGRR